MSTLIITRGIPASGKSTWAKKWVTEAPNRIRLNRDDFRFGLFVKPSYEHDQEELITQIEKRAASDALKKGRDVVVDATNLRPKYIREWHKLAQSHQAEFEIRDFPIDLDEAIRRDYWRGEHAVGEGVIRRMWERNTNNGEFIPYTFTEEEVSPVWESYIPNENNPTTIIVDMDGTLALNETGRSPFDWSRVYEDSVNEPIREIVRQAYIKGHRVLVCSGREDTCQEDTRRWLKDHGIPYDRLLMRKAGDFRKDSFVKYEIFDKQIRDFYNVIYVLDDRQQVVDMWRAIGLACLQVAEGNF